MNISVIFNTNDKKLTWGFLNISSGLTEQVSSEQMKSRMQFYFTLNSYLTALTSVCTLRLAS